MTLPIEARRAKGAVAFIGLSYLASVTVSLVVYFTGGQNSNLAQAMGLAVMLTPALIVLLLGAFGIADAHDPGFQTFPLKFVLIGIFVPVVVSHLALFTGALLESGRIPWSEWTRGGSDGLFHPPAVLNFGYSLTGTALALKFAVKLLVGLAIVTFFALGEEIGWRGFLQPRLIKESSPGRGIIITALLWAGWHIPYAISGIDYVPGVSVWQMATLMPLGIFGLGIFLGHLYLKTGSVWVVALAHGATNNWGQFVFRWFVEGDDRLNLVLIVSENVGLLLLGLVFLPRLFAKTPDTPLS
jgi:membrane protease YdiL (CAAX protease family)